MCVPNLDYKKYIDWSCANWGVKFKLKIIYVIVHRKQWKISISMFGILYKFYLYGMLVEIGIVIRN